MSKRRCLLVTVLLLAGGEISIAADASDRLPNIVLFFVDDFGQRDLSCYGSELYETPHMDRLAREGMRFTNAYAAYPRCVPSRQGLLSGKYPARIDFASMQRKGKQHALPLSEVTFAEVLRERGYQTCYIGKWHLGHDGGEPSMQGFETVIHSGSAGATNSHFAPFGTEKGHTIDNPVSAKPGDYLTDRLTDAATDYIRSHVEDPFLMVLAHYAVHTPLEAPEALEKKYRRKLRKSGVAVGGKRDDADIVIDRQGATKTLQNNPAYAGMVEKTDESLGRVMTTLEETGLADRTIVILTSDHGGLSTRGKESRRELATSNAPLRQGKGSIFEGGTRVPLIVKWPGTVTAGTISSVSVTGTDHYPTMLEMTGTPLRPQQHIDGRSYVRALRGETYERDPLFWYKWQARPDSTGDTRALSLIEGKFKLIEWIDEDNRLELYDLKRDPSERNNLAEAHPERVKRMAKTLHAMEEEVGNLRAAGREAMRKREARKRKRGR